MYAFDQFLHDDTPTSIVSTKRDGDSRVDLPDDCLMQGRSARWPQAGPAAPVAWDAFNMTMGSMEGADQMRSGAPNPFLASYSQDLGDDERQPPTRGWAA
jgi:hypothetical protein